MKTNTTQRAGTRRRGEHGTSLIEVMVVLVVLLIGVFTVIRIFPIGFLGLRQAENRTLANRLASQLMGDLQGNQTNLPQGIAFAYLTGTTVQFEPGQDPDDLGPYPEGSTNPYFTDVNKFRFIEGESTKVPLPTFGAYGGGGIYTVKFGPIYLDPSLGTADSAPDTSAFLKVYGPQMRGIFVEAQPNRNDLSVAGYLRGRQTYLVDEGEPGESAYLMLPPEPGGKTVTYRVAFSYADANNGNRVSPKLLDMTVNSAVPFWQEIKDATTTYKDIVEGSIRVNRNFDRIQASGAWDVNDPYQYKLLVDNVAGTVANLGVLAFNPAGANYTERTPFGEQSLTAYMDYAVLDWHILHEDREVTVRMPGETEKPIKLTLNGIKRIGDPEGDLSIYGGLYPGGGTATPVDLDVFNLQTGQRLTAGTHFRIDPDERTGTYRTGTIYVNVDDTSAGYVPPGSQLRIFYKADGDWAVAAQKAYAEITAQVDGANNTIAPRPGDYKRYGQQGTSLYFDLSQINKSVVATIEYVGANNKRVRTAPLQMSVNDARAFDPAETYGVVNVSDYVKGIGADTSWRVIGPVRGVSLKVRVIWKDNASDPTNRWRIQDLDTYITRTPDA